MVVMFRGLPACECLAEWLPWYERVLLADGVIRNQLDIAQLIGGAPQSGGTHRPGGAYDAWQSQPRAIWVARMMRAMSWGRTRAQGFDPHQHGCLVGCPHNGGCRYQIDAGFAGFNGLGAGGRGGRDDGPVRVPAGTWREGIAWAKSYLAGNIPTLEGDDMSVLVNAKPSGAVFLLSPGRCTHVLDGSPAAFAAYKAANGGRDPINVDYGQFRALLQMYGVDPMAVDAAAGRVRNATTHRVAAGETWVQDVSGLLDAVIDRADTNQQKTSLRGVIAWSDSNFIALQQLIRAAASGDVDVDALADKLRDALGAEVADVLAERLGS